MRIVATAVAIALSALWLSLVAFTSASRAQRSCLVFQGDVPLLDWNCLRTPARMALPYSGEGGAVMFEGADPIPRADLCNPPPTMMIYTLSYFLPVVLALSASRCRRTSALAAVAFVFLSVPLQLFFGGFGLQPLLSAVGTLLAVAAAVLVRVESRSFALSSTSLDSRRATPTR